jgi:hypothetical protein
MPFSRTLPQNRRARVIAVTSAALVVVAGVTTALVVNPFSDDLAERPELTAEGLESYFFEDPATMAATSELVVIAEVVAVEPGRTTGESAPTGDRPGDLETIRNIVIEIEEVLHDPNGTATELTSLTVEEGSWDSQGTGIAVNGLTWSEVGDRGYFFLQPVDLEDGSGDLYALISSYGRVLLDGESAELSGHHPEEEGPWAPPSAEDTGAEVDPSPAEDPAVEVDPPSAEDTGAEVGTMSTTEISSESIASLILAAVAAAESGEAQPAEEH